MKAFIGFGLLMVVVSCGDSAQHVSTVTAGRVDGSCLSKRQSTDVTATCVDYEDMTWEQLDSTKATCQDNESFKRSFVQGQFCAAAGKLGGCVLPVKDGISVTIWSYGSNDPDVDNGIRTLAKDTCEKAPLEKNRGVWSPAS